MERVIRSLKKFFSLTKTLIIGTHYFVYILKNKNRVFIANLNIKYCLILLKAFTEVKKFNSIFLLVYKAPKIVLSRYSKKPQHIFHN